MILRSCKFAMILRPTNYKREEDRLVIRESCVQRLKKFLKEVTTMNARIILVGGGRRRSWQREALLVAGAAGIGTAVGALTAGKKGATFGAISAGVSRYLMRVAQWEAASPLPTDNS